MLTGIVTAEANVGQCRCCGGRGILGAAMIID
jgi:hypothetical protein